MAIQFDCPYCTSTLKVPDSSAGKQGDCPRCGTKLVIPNPFAAAGQASPADQAAQTASEQPTTEAPAQTEQAVVPPSGENISIGKQPLKSATAQYLRKRRKSNVGSILLCILFFGMMLGAAGYFYWAYGPQLEGNLVGARLKTDARLEQLQKTSNLGLSDEVIQAVNDSLKQTPRKVQSDMMEMLFFGPDQGGFKVRLKAGPKTELVRVDLTGDPALMDYIRQHGPQLDQPRLAELQSQLKAFYTDWYQFVQEGGVMPDLIHYRNTIGLNSLMGGLGYNMEARVNNRIYPCVHDDFDGGLYFLVPRGTLQFEIQGREMENGWTKFPGKYTVQVTQEYQGI